MTLAQEYDAVRSAIQQIVAGAAVVSVSVGGMAITYSASRLADLERREETLARRLGVRNIRKRTTMEIT